MSSISKQHALQYFDKGIHIDGRAIKDLRNITIEYGVSKSAEGSARARLGETDVIAGVKLEIEQPYTDTFDQGNLAVNVELLPLSSPEFESGPPGNQANELARVVDRGIRESHVINLKKLCITPHEKAWSVMIDVCTINDAGNLLDACAIAALAALQDTKLPAIKDGEVDYSTKTNEKLPVDDLSVSVTIYKVGKHLVVDPDTVEEKLVEARLTVASKSDGMLCAFQKGGESPLTAEDVQEMVDIALETAAKIRQELEG